MSTIPDENPTSKPSIRSSRRRLLETQPTNKTLFFDVLGERDHEEVRRQLQRASVSLGEHSHRSSSLGSQDGPSLPEAVEVMQSLCGDLFVPRAQLKEKGRIGEGAFAVVEKAVLSRASNDGPKQVVVAVKKLHPEVVSDPVEFEMFLNEVNTLRKLQHPYIVGFKGVGATNTTTLATMRGSMYLVQEYMPGGTLKRALLQEVLRATVGGGCRRTYRRQDLCRWAACVADALRYLHTHDPMVVHRDLKAENAMLTSSNLAEADVKLVDFGLHCSIKDVASHVPSTQTLSDEDVDRVRHELSESTGTGLSLLEDGSQGSRQPVAKRIALIRHDTLKRSRERGSLDDSAMNAITSFEVGLRAGVGPSATGASVTAINIQALMRSASAVEDAAGVTDGGTAAAATDKAAQPEGKPGLLHRRVSSKKKRGGAKAGQEAARREALYDLTGETGSILYMAPEVLRGKFYNEKVDIFSFGILLWELASYTSTSSLLITFGHQDGLDVVAEYGQKVADGFRQPIPDTWPPEIRTLIFDCWAQDPGQRPSAAQVLVRLRAIQKKGVDVAWDAADQDVQPRGCCCTIC